MAVRHCLGTARLNAARTGRAAALLCAGLCATPVSGACFDGAAEALVAELLFGRNVGTRLGVSERDFRRFVDREVSPRFPDGFTLLDTHGQFRHAENALIVREPGKYLLIALGDEARDLPRVAAIADAYKTQFRQESVAVLTRRACVSFSAPAPTRDARNDRAGVPSASGAFMAFGRWTLSVRPLGATVTRRPSPEPVNADIRE